MRLALWIPLSLLTLCAIPLLVSADPNGTWEPLNPPSGRQDVLSVYDPAHDRMLVFGGNSGTSPLAIPFGELWSLDLATWTWHLLIPLVPGPEGPGMRYQSSMVYDSNRQRVLLFGGSSDANGNFPLSDLWSLPLDGVSGWQRLSDAGYVPARFNHVAIYDPVGDRMIIHGGKNPSNVLNDTWQLTLSPEPIWSQLTPTSPPSLQGASAIYDPVRQRMLVFGGSDNGGARRNGVWALSLSAPYTWAQILNGVGPSARSGHTAVYDPVHDSMIVYGGSVPWPNFDTWVLYLQANLWIQTAMSNQPNGRTEHAAIFDAFRNKMVVFGGLWSSGSGSNEIWTLNPDGNGTWSHVSGTQAGFGNAAFFDPVRNRIVSFNGSTSQNDTWARSTLPEGSWTQLFPAGTPPPKTSGQTFIYDPIRDRGILYGGFPVSTVWSLEMANGEEWVQLFPTGQSPPTRVSHSAVYDRVRDRMLIFGGSNGTETKNDLWELRFGTNQWSAIIASGALPPTRMQAAMVLDPIHDRLLVFGGGTNSTSFNDLWTLSLHGTPTWTQPSNGGMAPSPRWAPQAFYDVSLDRMVLFGGSNKNDLWELNGSTAMWTQLTPGGGIPAAGYSSFGVYDSNQRDFYTGGFWGESVWALHFGPATTGLVDNSASPRLKVTISPNPFRGATNIRFSLDNDGLAQLTIHDLNGRRVATPLARTLLPAGPHEIQWRPSGLGNGVYFYRLQSVQGTQSGRIMLLQ